MRKLAAFALFGGLTTLAISVPALAAHGHRGAAPARRPGSAAASGARGPVGQGASPGSPRVGGYLGPSGKNLRRLDYRGATWGVAGGFGAGIVAGPVDGDIGYEGYDPAFGDGSYEIYPVVQAYDPNGWEVYGGSFAGTGNVPQIDGPPVQYVQAPPPRLYAISAYTMAPGPADRIAVSAPYVQEAAAGQPVYFSPPYTLASPTCGRWTWNNGVVTYAWVAC